MKRLIVYTAVVLCFTAPAIAQNVAPVTTVAEQSANTKRIFASKINELSAYASRNSTDLVKKTALEVMTMMQQQARLTYSAMEKTSDNTEKSTLRKKYQEQTKIILSVKEKMGDPVKNVQPVVNSLKDFQNTL